MTLSMNVYLDLNLISVCIICQICVIKHTSHKKSLDKIASSSCKYSADQPQIEVDQPNNVSLSVQPRRSVSKPRITINTPYENPSSKPCIVCAQVKIKGDTKKYRMSECDRARTFLESAMFLQDEVHVYTRVCDLQDEYSVFGAELFYHSNCMRRYLRQYAFESCKMEIPCKFRKREAFAEIIKDIDVKVLSGETLVISDLSVKANGYIATSDSPFTNKEIRLRLINHYCLCPIFSEAKGSASTVFYMEG